MRLPPAIFLHFLLFAGPLAARPHPEGLSGKILDAATGEAVPGATVVLDNSTVWAVSDGNGVFSFKALTPGEHDVEVSCLGYVTRTLRIGTGSGKEPLEIRLSVNSLALDGVTVTAETSRDQLNTTRKIGRNALDHLQMSGVSDISALLPGGKTVNPDLTSEHAMSLRSGGSSAGNAAFGTAVEVDGVRMGDNASFRSLAGAGTRGLSVGNIESVEVLTGVPSAEYGDLGAGLVKIHTKKGRTPLQLTCSVNPRTYEISAAKGVEMGRGFLNISGEWVRATQKLSSPYTSYTRRGFTVDYSGTFRKALRLEAGLTGNIGGMNSRNDPDLLAEEYTRVRDNLLTPHAKLVWLLQKPWATNLSLEASVWYHDNRSHDHLYHSSGSSQPAVHSEAEGYFFADELPLTYYSDRIVDSRELDWTAALKYDWLHQRNGRKSLLKAGLQWKADGNAGAGERYEDPSLAENGYRPRPYADYPWMHHLALYAEEKLTLPAGGTKIELSAGLRFGKVFLKGTSYKHLHTLSPRFNARWAFGRKLTLRGGWGITRKLPGFFILFPRQEYRDIQTFGWSYGSEGASRYVYFTQPYALEYNSALKWQSNSNAEIGAELSLGGVQLSLTGFLNRTRNPYGFTTTYTPFAYNIVALPAGFTLPANPEVTLDSSTGTVSFKDGTGAWVQSQLKVIDRTFVPSRRQSNGGDVERYGVELTADFPEIRVLRTHFRLDAAYTRTYYVDDNLNDSYRTGWSHTSLPDRSYQYVGTYASPGTVSNGLESRTLDANLTAITHLPEARLVVTCRLEGALLRRSRNLSEHGGRPYAFTTDDGYPAVWPVRYTGLDGVSRPFTETEAADDAFSRLLLRSGNIYTLFQDGYDPYFSANLSVTKEIGDHVSFSFFANNFTNSRKFVRSKATGAGAIFTPDFYYGLTCRLKF